MPTTRMQKRKTKSQERIELEDKFKELVERSSLIHCFAGFFRHFFVRNDVLYMEVENGNVSSESMFKLIKIKEVPLHMKMESDNVIFMVDHQEMEFFQQI